MDSASCNSKYIDFLLNDDSAYPQKFGDVDWYEVNVPVIFWDSLDLVHDTLRYAYSEHPDKHPSLEHSMMVLLEEVDELKQEICKQEKERSNVRIYEEAAHVAACALRLLIDRGITLENIHEDIVLA